MSEEEPGYIDNSQNMATMEERRYTSEEENFRLSSSAPVQKCPRFDTGDDDEIVLSQPARVQFLLLLS